MMAQDLSFWIFVAAAVGFVAGVALTIKSYRDAKHASYFFLREEAALRVKRLLFVLVPLLVVTVFLGLRIFRPSLEGALGLEVAQLNPPPPAATEPASPVATIGATAPVSPTQSISPIANTSPTATLAISPISDAGATPAAATATTSPVAVPNELPTTTPSDGSTPAPASPTFTAPATTSVPGATVTGTLPTASAASGTPAMGVPLTGTVTATPSPTATDTPVVGRATPQTAATMGPIVLSRTLIGKRPKEPSTVFAAGAGNLYAFFEYGNMTNGVSWSHRWYRGGQQVGGEGFIWNWGFEGTAHVFISMVGFTPGQYELRLYIGDQMKASQGFEVR